MTTFRQTLINHASSDLEHALEIFQALLLAAIGIKPNTTMNYTVRTLTDPQGFRRPLVLIEDVPITLNENKDICVILTDGSFKTFNSRLELGHVLIDATKSETPEKLAQQTGLYKRLPVLQPGCSFHRNPADDNQQTPPETEAIPEQ